MAEIVLETIDIVKRFPGTLANDHISVKFEKGTIHAIMGENGAGKSTFCNVITGLMRPDEGKILLDNNEIHFRSIHHALTQGISMVYQERNLIGGFTGYQNIFLGNEPTRSFLRVVDDKKLREEVDRLFADIKVANLPLDVPVSSLNPGQQQMIEILRALRFKSKILILDEPTASLSKEESTQLFRILKKLVLIGTTIVFISHKIDEIFSISDTISIFRNGSCVHTGPIKEISKDECIKLMVNRDLKQLYPKYEPHVTETTILHAKGIKDVTGRVVDADFELKEGEIVGWYGLVGSGRTEFAQTIYGLRRKERGLVKFHDKDISSLKASSIMREGIYLIPEDRAKNAIFDYFNIRRNISVNYLSELKRGIFGYISPKSENKIVKYCLNNDLKVKYNTLTDEMDSLSGGNKQKVILSRSIYKENVQIIIADEPTQGIDVGTKYDIYTAMIGLAAKGVSIVFISSELPELIGVCSRICVFNRGKIVVELAKEHFDSDAIMKYAINI